MVRAILVWGPSAGIGGHGLRPFAKQFIFDFDHHLLNGLGKYRIDPHVQSFRGLALLLVSFSFIFPVDELGVCHLVDSPYGFYILPTSSAFLLCR